MSRTSIVTNLSQLQSVPEASNPLDEEDMNGLRPATGTRSSVTFDIKEANSDARTGGPRSNRMHSLNGRNTKSSF